MRAETKYDQRIWRAALLAVVWVGVWTMVDHSLEARDQPFAYTFSLGPSPDDGGQNALPPIMMVPTTPAPNAFAGRRTSGTPESFTDGSAHP